jgi:uncharacterized protein
MLYRLRMLLLLGALGCAAAFGHARTPDQDAAQLFEQGMNALAGTGLSRSPVLAVDALRRSAELGYAPAQVVLGSLYQLGKVVAQEPAQALEWYKKAAEQDDPLAEWLAGSLIYSGDSGVRDLNEAGAWFRKAAKHGDPFGQYLLGMVELDRNNYGEAAGWFRKAAMQGLPRAQQQLGALLRQGHGVSQDRFEAYIWLWLSFEAGNESVSNDLQALEAVLGSSQVEQAKNKARNMEIRTALDSRCSGWRGEFQVIPTPPPPEMQRYCRE